MDTPTSNLYPATVYKKDSLIVVSGHFYQIRFPKEQWCYEFLHLPDDGLAVAEAIKVDMPWWFQMVPFLRAMDQQPELLKERIK